MMQDRKVEQLQRVCGIALEDNLGASDVDGTALETINVIGTALEVNQTAGA